MSRLIDADVFIGNIVSIADLRTISTKTIGEALDKTPTVDAIEVVRCRECRWCNMGECEHKFGLLVSNDENYCSYGERDGEHEAD